MIDIYSITKALYDQIRTHDEVVQDSFNVTHSEYVNMDPDLTPWVGIYKGPVSYDPGSLGRHSQSWDATITLQVVVQASHGDNSLKCSERLSDYEKIVLDAIWSDPTIGNNVDMIEALNLEYAYNNEASESMYHQQAIITITARTSTG